MGLQRTRTPTSSRPSSCASTSSTAAATAPRSGRRAPRAPGLTAGRALAEQQIRIEVQEAITDLEVAEASLETARRRVEAAEAAYAIVAKKRDLGQVSSAEYLDAQRALTQARLNGNVTRFQALGALAQVEYAIGGMEQP